ncbi:hypothetical protein M877_28925 [Streptomyces niveus NCIMB 11891]|nr:hypothetical protein M877_28925 [Streptomyces niveus NCIMB 11891]
MPPFACELDHGQATDRVGAGERVLLDHGRNNSGDGVGDP